MNWVAALKDRMRTLAGHPDPGERKAAEEAIRIETPASGAHWRCVERCVVRWQVTGALDYPCKVLLEKPTPAGWQPVVTLATLVDPRACQVAVAVPAMPEGTYRVRIDSPELAAAACSGSLSLTP